MTTRITWERQTMFSRLWEAKEIKKKKKTTKCSEFVQINKSKIKQETSIHLLSLFLAIGQYPKIKLGTQVFIYLVCFRPSLICVQKIEIVWLPIDTQRPTIVQTLNRTWKSDNCIKCNILVDTTGSVLWLHVSGEKINLLQFLSSL